MSQIRGENNTSGAFKMPTLLLGILLLLALTTSVALAAPNTQDPVNGEQVWQESLCKNCHGENGAGLWAGPLAGSGKTAEEWITQVRTPRRNMPAFSAEQVSDAAITDMHAYLTTLVRPEGFSPADAGLPDNAPQGQQLLVEKRCVACHTTGGPTRGFIARGETPTADAVITQLRTPRQNMPTFSSEQVSDADANAITEFLVLQVSAPAQLPQSGGSSTLTLPLVLASIGAGMVLAALYLRLLKVSHS